MRVTDRAIFEAARASTTVARERMSRATSEMSTGLRVTHPGDDPMAASQAVLLGADQSAHVARKRALDAAQAELDLADGALGGISDSLRRAQELTIQMASDTYSREDRKAAKAEVESLFQGIVSQLNIKSGDRYLFGGTADATEPFDAAGQYLGRNDRREVEIFPGVYQKASVRADSALKGTDLAGGGVDVLDTLVKLATALDNNDGAGIRAAIEPLETGLGQVLLTRAEIGSYSNVVSMASTAAQAAQDASLKKRAAIMEVDPFEAATNLSLAERALDAALSASARSFQLTLLDKLR
jgi:flagellar hook-associated protein 3 FlgL